MIAEIWVQCQLLKSEDGVGTGVRRNLWLALRHLGCSRLRPNAVAAAVRCYIRAAYWFSASTSLRESFAGIRLIDSSFSRPPWGP